MAQAVRTSKIITKSTPSWSPYQQNQNTFETKQDPKTN
jgi:hypothetical protein